MGKSAVALGGLYRISVQLWVLLRKEEFHSPVFISYLQHSDVCLLEQAQERYSCTSSIYIYTLIAFMGTWSGALAIQNAYVSHDVFVNSDAIQFSLDICSTYLVYIAACVYKQTSLHKIIPPLKISLSLNICSLQRVCFGLKGTSMHLLYAAIVCAC